MNRHGQSLPTLDQVCILAYGVALAYDVVLFRKSIINIIIILRGLHIKQTYSSNIWLVNNAVI